MNLRTTAAPLSRLVGQLRAARRGSVAITSAFGFTFAMMGVGYAVDVNMMQSTGMRLQDVADTAALAGATKAARGTTSESAIRSESLAVMQAMTAQSANASITGAVTYRPGDDQEVTVQASKSIALFFGKAFKDSSLTMVRQATAVVSQKMPLCLLVLEPQASDAFSMQGTPDLVAPGCAVQVNSRSPDAVEMGGSASATTKATYVSGKSGGGGGNMKPAPSYEAPAIADPIAARITWPNPSGCDFNDGIAKKEVRVLSPGVYCGGIGADTHGELTLTPGLYVIKTGDLTLGSGGVINAPVGVTIVMLDPEGTIDIGSKGSLRISAPKTGPWAGIAVAVKPQPTRLTSSMQGGGEMLLDGVVYLPSQKLHLTGGGQMEASLTNRMFVVNSIEMKGNGQIRLKGDPAIMAIGGSARLKS